MNCYNMVSDVIEEATKQFSPIYQINDEYEDVLEQYCDAIDELGAEVSAEGFYVDVDEITMNISIGVISPEFTLTEYYKIFCDLLKRSVGFRVIRDDDNENIITMFIFPPIWEKTIK